MKEQTYYQRCKKWANQYGDTLESRFIPNARPAGKYRGRWQVWTMAWAEALGRTRELACKRLWETLLELGVVKENAP